MRLTKWQLRRVIHETVTAKKPIVVTRNMLRRMINEAIGSMIHVWYHPIGVDNNGNGGPALSDLGWITVEVPESDGNTLTQAVSQLPTAEQQKIYNAMTANGASSPRELIENTAGWGLDFTLAVEEFDELDDLQ